VIATPNDVANEERIPIGSTQAVGIERKAVEESLPITILTTTTMALTATNTIDKGNVGDLRKRHGAIREDMEVLASMKSRWMSTTPSFPDPVVPLVAHPGNLPHRRAREIVQDADRDMRERKGEWKQRNRLLPRPRRNPIAIEIVKVTEGATAEAEVTPKAVQEKMLPLSARGSIVARPKTSIRVTVMMSAVGRENGVAEKGRRDSALPRNIRRPIPPIVRFNYLMQMLSRGSTPTTKERACATGTSRLGTLVTKSSGGWKRDASVEKKIT
jgi:hypothetical protein